jgi:hypothetical protein
VSYTDLAEGAHAFSVYATDVVGNADASPATASWTIDLTAPVVSITSWPTTPVSDADPEFAFEANEATTFECAADGGAFEPCTSPTTAAPLADGWHTFTVRATDVAGHSATDSVEFVVDTVAPALDAETTCADEGANGWCRSATVAYSASAADETTTVVDSGCTVDGLSVPCEGEIVGEGVHTLVAYAEDAAGNRETLELTISIDSLTPTGQASAPLVAAEAYEVDWTAEDGGSGVALVEVLRASLGSEDVAVVCEIEGDGSASVSGSCEDDPLPGQACYGLRVTDVAGNVATTPIADPLGGLQGAACTVKVAPDSPVAAIATPLARGPAALAPENVTLP